MLPLSARRQQALLATLLLSANEIVTLGRLVAAVWGENPPASAVINIRTHVGALRRVLGRAGGGPRVATRPGGYVITVAPEELDLLRFEALAGRGERAMEEGDHVRAAREFDGALALWRGEVAEGVELAGSAEAELVRLQERRLTVCEQSVRARLALGRHAELLAELRGLTLEHPLRESLHGLLMLVLHRAGLQAEALAAYGRLTHILSEELGIEPAAEVRELRQRILRGDPVPAAPGPVSRARVRCDLPYDIGDFTGREGELDGLALAVRDTAGTAALTTVSISAIDGMAGIGKTTLAVRLAHHLAEKYPDGQLFIDLHAHTPGQPPLTAAVALEKLLRAMGVPGDAIPESTEDRAAAWRSTLAGRRVLVVLDNAVDSAQVRPLLPGARCCLTLITSRRRLAGIDSAALVSLDVLTPGQAGSLFRRVVGDGRPDREPGTVAEVLALCGHLPLAVRLAAARLRHRPAWTVSQLAERLRDGGRRLAELRDDHSSVSAVFALSYQHLMPPQRELFCLLALHPGPDFDAYAAAALVGRPVSGVRDLLEELVDVHLLQQPVAGRYRFHDLLRAYAEQLAGTEEPESVRDAALTGLLDHYLTVAAAAMDTACPFDKARRPPVPPPGPVPGPIPGIGDPDAALAWLSAEQANLMAAGRLAAEQGRQRHVAGLSATLARYLDTRARYDDALTLHAAALEVGRRQSDFAGQSLAAYHLGWVHVWLDHREKAYELMQESLLFARKAGDRLGEGYAHAGLGHVHLDSGRYDEALEHSREALRHARWADDLLLQGYALIALACVHRDLHDYGKALRYYSEAAEVGSRTDDAMVRGRAANGLGHAYVQLGRHDEARHHLEEALAFAVQSCHRSLENYARAGLAALDRPAED
ncbi:BTAD domain-containing putative transcriptional regulator [Streptomyces sp. NPDC058371]|uniref:AfsR/SARP family transcriptional regulator n=1 Tax=Streptomyces sp. NPDC058371 TaxID=3346463 RepID=UPI00364918A5